LPQNGPDEASEGIYPGRGQDPFSVDFYGRKVLTYIYVVVIEEKKMMAGKEEDRFFYYFGYFSFRSASALFRLNR